MPVPGAAGPAGRPALRRLRRAVRDRRDSGTDRGRVVTPGRRRLIAMRAQRLRGFGAACLRQLPATLGVILLIGAIYLVQKEFRHLRLRDIEAALHDYPARALSIGFLWT